MKRLLTMLMAIVALAVLDPVQASAQMLAFPGADGYAKYVTGGRGGKVYYVTSLDDCSDDNLVPGTLRWALRTGDDTPRTILFAVNGTIYLSSKLKTNHPNVSILGQSAPGGGVCITGYPVVINSYNYIVRYVRFRAGEIPALQSNGNLSFSGLDIENAYNIMLDHCSVTWSMEECLTMFDNDCTTVQYCIIGEGLYHSYNVKTTGDSSGRAFAMQWGGEHSTMHHTLITNSNGRGPRFNGVREKNGWLAGANGKTHAHDVNLDGEFANNVLYNFGGSHLSYYGGEFYKDYFAEMPTEYGEAYGRVYMINNYFRPGPSTKVNGANNRCFIYASGDTDNQMGQWYLSGNKFETGSYYAPSSSLWSDESLAKVNNDNMYGYASGSSEAAFSLGSSDYATIYKNHVMTELPYALSGYEYESADVAYAKTMKNAGANLPRLDEEDQRLIDEAAGKRNGVTPFYGSRATNATSHPGIIDTPEDIKFNNGTDAVTVNGTTYSCYPTLKLNDGEKYSVDNDGDGMPDAYENAVGLNPSDASDGNKTNAAGYTNLEVYMNALADGSIKNSDYQSSETFVEPGLTSRPEYITISFENTDETIVGTAPASMKVAYGSKVTLQPSWTFYKEGYTLTGWTDGNMTYAFNTEYNNFVEDVTLQPSMTKNKSNIADRTDDVTFTWDFTSNAAPKLADGKSGIYVTRGWIDSDSLDVKLDYDGLNLTLPADKGAVATVTYSNGSTNEYAAVGSTLNIALSNADVKTVSINIPYIFDPTGIEFHSPAVGTCNVNSTSPNATNASGFSASAASNYELVYGDTLTVDNIEWMETIGQHRNAYRNCIDPIKEDGTYSSDNATTTPLYGFVVGQSTSSTYKLVAYVKDCAKVRTFASGSSTTGDMVLLTAIPADGSERLTANNLHVLKKSESLSETFDLELDPEKSYKLIWTSVSGNDMMIGAIKLFDKTAASANSGNTAVTWTWGSYEEAGVADPAKAFSKTSATYSSGWGTPSTYMSAVCFTSTSAITEKSDNNVVKFTVTPAAGYKFKPTKVSFYASISGKGNIDVVGQQGEKSAQTIKSAQAVTAGQVQYSYDITGVDASTDSYTISLYAYNVIAGRRHCLRSIVIEGEYDGQVVKHSFATQVSPENSGVITQTPKGTSFAETAQITLTATPVTGYSFQNWTNSNGNVVSTDAKFVYTVGSADETLTANFKDLASSSIFKDGPYQAVVSNAEELTEALVAAKQSTASRYYIFLKNGDYDFGTTAKTAVPQNTSLIGESQNGVLIHNCPSASVTNYQDDTPVLFTDKNQNNIYMQDLTIRQSRDWATKTSQGQALALRQRGKYAVYKNVTLQGVQDTYYLNQGDGSAYFETSTVAGEVDFIYGDGTMFFQNCSLQPVSSSAYITAPNTQSAYIGIVFNECTIEKEATAKDNVTGYRLGRPWGDSPASTFINTTMKVLPSAAGWGSMSSNCVIRFHEYGSKDASGNLLDLSSRSIAACTPADGSDSPVLSETEAAEYTISKVFNKVAPDWDPASLAAQLTAPTVAVSGSSLTWSAVDGAYCYAIVKDGSVIDFTTSTSYALPSSGKYSIRVANQRGGLGTASNAVEATVTGIEAVENSAESATIYDVQGRKLNAPVKGINIINGVKVLK